MSRRTPLTSAERQLVEAQRLREGRARRGREPERLPNFGPLHIDGALPVGHPLETTTEDRRRLRKRMQAKPEERGSR